MTHIELAEILSTALNYHEVEGEGGDVLLTSLPEENAAFSEFDIHIDGELFEITVRKR